MRLLLPLTLALTSAAQQPLHTRLVAIAADAHGKVSIACSLPGTNLDCNLNPHLHSSMQSTFKLPEAMTLLHLVDQGKLSLDQPVHFAPADRMPGSYSPLQDAHPNANIDLSLREVIRLMVSDSDNVASELGLPLAGGPAGITTYLESLGLTQIRVMDGERAMGKDERLQYRNWAEAADMVRLLRVLADKSPFTPATTALLSDAMTHAMTGAKRLRAGLPPGTILAHKTGTSGTENGLSPATNDLGLVTLPDGRRLAIAVFVVDSTAPADTRDAVIARVGRAIYDSACQNPAH